MNEDEPGRSWWELLNSLGARLNQLTSESCLDWALARFLLRENLDEPVGVFEFSPFDKGGFLSSFTPTATNTAALGFLLGITEIPALDVKAKLLQGINRCRRQSRPSMGPSVHSEPRLLVGLAAGLKTIGDESDLTVWLREQLNCLDKRDVEKAVMGCYGRLLSADKDVWKDLETTLVTAQPVDPKEAALVLWALNLDPSKFSDAHRNELDKIRQQSLQALPFLPVECLDSLGCVIALWVVSHLLRGSIMDLERTAAGRLIEILGRLPVALAKERQEPRDEYDIQRVLWTMLAGVYPDLRDEQWLEQFGVFQPRADLAIESLKTIVEAKFIRRANAFHKIQEELISDAASYTKKPERFDRVVAIVYDATSSQHKYEQLREALERVPGVSKILVFSKVTPRPTKRRKSGVRRTGE